MTMQQILSRGLARCTAVALLGAGLALGPVPVVHASPASVEAGISWSSTKPG